MEVPPPLPASHAPTLLLKIQGFTRFLLSTICQKGELPYALLDRYQSYCADPTGNCACGTNEPIGKEMISFGNANQGLRLAQAVVDQAINDICVLLGCSRHNLHVVSVGCGLVMGWLRFQEAGRHINCLRRPSNGYHIPVHTEDIEGIVSFAEYILVVEKETVFQRLSDDGFCEANKCIVITGRGYPDVSTRRFLRLLVAHLNLPAYCLVDCDPHGFDILATYRFGSMKMAYDTKLLQVPNIRWLGVFPSDCEKYNLPDRCRLPLNQTDVKKIEAMLKRCYLQREAPQWRAELQIMLQNGVKFEIEALSVSSISFLSETYLTTKLGSGIYV